MEPRAYLTAADVRAVFRAYLECLREHRESLNRLNVYPVPDADTGTNLWLTTGAVCEEVAMATDMTSTAQAIARGALMGARGISGVVLSAALRGLVDRLDERDTVDGPTLADALAAASRSADESVADPVEGTILTVARAAAEGARSAASHALLDVVEAARSAAADALARTPDLLPPLRAAGVVDAGGAGFVLLLDALLHVVDGRALPPSTPVAEPTIGRRVASEGDEGDRRYELACLLEVPDEAVPALRVAWRRIGGAVAVVGGEGRWTCHVHTDSPGEALEVAAGFGRPREARVTDLVLQVVEERALPLETNDDVTTAVVATCTGDGVRALLRSLGARTVTGSRSLRPSVGELVEAVEACSADQVLLLANDDRVVAAAREVPELTRKRVRVVATRTVCEGLSALQDYDPDVSADENADRMREAVDRVRSGELVRAVRDAGSDVGPIRRGQWLGVARDGVRVVADDVGRAAALLLADLVDDGPRIVTVLEGEDSTDQASSRILSWLRERRPQAGVQILRGGQPLQAYAFGVE